MAPPAKAWQRLIFGLILAWWTCTAAAIQPVPREMLAESNTSTSASGTMERASTADW